MSDILARIVSAAEAMRRPIVRVVNTGDARQAYVYAPEGERRTVFLHPDTAARIGVIDGDELPDPEPDVLQPCSVCGDPDNGHDHVPS